ncbi:hypothetical protein NQZ68_024755 [Dissostichus eleginoides]|nr:hypothetical protein NQZ68_024755 [Dissostichus eleginoides]
MNEAREGEIKPLQHTCSHLFTAFTDPPPGAKHKERDSRRRWSICRDSTSRGHIGLSLLVVLSFVLLSHATRLLFFQIQGDHTKFTLDTKSLLCLGLLGLFKPRRDVLPSQPSETGPPVSIQLEMEPVGHCNRSQPRLTFRTVTWTLLLLHGEQYHHPPYVPAEDSGWGWECPSLLGFSTEGGRKAHTGPNISVPDNSSSVWIGFYNSA